MGVLGQLVVLVQVWVEAHSLPEQGVGILSPAYAVAAVVDYEGAMPSPYREPVVRTRIQKIVHGL